MGSDITDDIDISMPALWRAWQAFARGKARSPGLRMFYWNLEHQLLVLEQALASGTYHHHPYQNFIVHDPKRRDIAVASIRDRVVHRLLYEHLVIKWDKTFSYDSWSCRPQKGLIGAINRAQSHARRYRHGWIWRSDITRFFDSVDHARLCFILRTKLAHDSRAYKLLDTVIASYQTNAGDSPRGIPIGNLTSQIFANIYLNEFDQFVHSTLRPLGYVRYGDDFVLWCRDEAAAQEARIVGSQFLCDYLHLAVNPAHDTVQAAAQRLACLGVELWPTGRRLPAKTHRRIQRKRSVHNLSSYEALIAHHLPTRYVRRSRWETLDILEEV